MHILVTGGCGYVGTVLTEKLLERGHQVTVVDNMWFGNHLKPRESLKIIKADIRDTASLPWKEIERDGIKAIVHLANIANDPSVDLDPKLSWEVNALATMQLADRAARHGVQQFIFASSGSVYGVKEEPQVTEDLTLEPISEYNKTKMVADRVLLSYGKDMIVQIVRPATVCGFSPRMRLDLSVNMLTMQALAKKQITVLGGDQVRPNIHIQDLVGVYLHFLESGPKHQGIFNAGFENMSIMQIARKISETIPAEIVVKPSNDPRSYRLNSDKLLATGFKPKFTVADGIREVSEGYNAGRIKDADDCYNVRWMKKNLF